MKNSGILFLWAAVSALAVSGCGGKGGGAEDGGAAKTLADNPVRVRVETVGKKIFERRMNVQGSLESYESAVVSARVGGPLTDVCVDVGDKVKKGETVLFKVDTVELENRLLIAKEDVGTARASLAVAEANLAKAEAEAEKIRLDADRYERLHADGRVSDSEYETASVNRKTADAQVAVAEANVRLCSQQISQAEASLKIAERNLSDATAVSPIDGYVSERVKEPGEQVSPGTHVVTLNGTDKVKAIAFLPSQYYSDVIPGETEFDLSFRGEPVGRFKISVKSPVVDMTLRTFEFRGILENVPSAVPGRMGDFKVVFSSREGLSVPDESVIERRAGKIVFVEENGIARERIVKTGLRNDGRTEIVEGLSEGEKVLVEGQFLAYDGCRVSIAE